MVENAPMFINWKSHDMTCRIVRSCHGISCFFIQLFVYMAMLWYSWLCSFDFMSLELL